jgi:hypothetical protein
MVTYKFGKAPDKDFPFLTQDEGRDLRMLAVVEFAKRGVPVQMRGDHAAGPDGRTYPLGDLAEACKNGEAGRPGWQEAVTKHVDAAIREPGFKAE